MALDTIESINKSIEHALNNTESMEAEVEKLKDLYASAYEYYLSVQKSNPEDPEVIRLGSNLDAINTKIELSEKILKPYKDLEAQIDYAEVVSNSSRMYRETRESRYQDMLDDSPYNDIGMDRLR